MKRFFLLLLFCLQITSLHAFPWYYTIGTGYAWTAKPGLTNPDTSVWDSSVQGYDHQLTNGSFLGLGFGVGVFHWLDFDIDWTMSRQFIYQMRQTGVSSTPGFTGDHRTRFFNVNNDVFLGNIRLHLPEDWKLDAGLFSLAPFVGGGVGFGVNQVSDFHTVTNTGTTTSLGKPNASTSFAWQANIGIAFTPRESSTSLNVAYRYFDGGNFDTGKIYTDNSTSGNGALINAAAWKADVKSHQLYVYLKCDI